MGNLFKEAAGQVGAERNGRKRGRIKEKENQDRKDHRTAAPRTVPLAFRERCCRGLMRDRTCRTAGGGGEPQTSRRPPTLIPLQGPCGFPRVLEKWPHWGGRGVGSEDHAGSDRFRV